MRVYEHARIGDALLDVVHLRLDRGEVVLRAALEHELPAQGGQARICTTYCQTFFGRTWARPASISALREALLLEVHAIGIEEDRAAVAELRGQRRP